MVYDAHMLHSIFVIKLLVEGHLKLPGSIVCLEQLRQALKSKASFTESANTYVHPCALVLPYQRDPALPAD